MNHHHISPADISFSATVGWRYGNESRYYKKSRNERRESRRIIFVVFFSIAVRKVSSCFVAPPPFLLQQCDCWLMEQWTEPLTLWGQFPKFRLRRAIPIVLDWTLATTSHKYNSSVFSLFFLGLSQREYHFSRIKDSQIHIQWLVISIGRDFVFNLSHGFSFPPVSKCMKPCHVYFCTLATPFNRWWTLTFCYFL